MCEESALLTPIARIVVRSNGFADATREPPDALRRPSQGAGRGAEEGVVGADDEQVEGVLTIQVKKEESGGGSTKGKRRAYILLSVPILV